MKAEERERDSRNELKKKTVFFLPAKEEEEEGKNDRKRVLCVCEGNY